MKKLFIALEPTLEIFLNDLMKQDCTVFIKQNLKYFIPNKLVLSKLNQALELGNENLTKNTNIFCKQIIPVILSQLKSKGVGEGLLNEEANKIINNYFKNNTAIVYSIMDQNIKSKFSKLVDTPYLKKSITSFINKVKDKYVDVFSSTNSSIISQILPQINLEAKEIFVSSESLKLEKNEPILNLEYQIREDLIKIGDFKNSENLYANIEKLLELYDKEVNQQLKDQNQATRTTALFKVLDLRLGILLRDICSFMSKEASPSFCDEKLLKIIDVFTDVKKEDYTTSELVGDLSSIIIPDISYILKQILIDISIESFPHLINDVLNSNKTKSELIFTDLGLNSEEIDNLEKPSYLDQYLGLSFMLDM
jgi:hypothetical protein